MNADLIDRARTGDEQAFGELVAPFGRELQVHCYRILGSALDAEDALQETLLAAWQGLAGFEGRSSLRVWLFRIATRRCLNALRSASRRPSPAWPPPGLEVPEPTTRRGDVSWLEPYPDVLEGLADTAPGPEARYEAREAISVAFVTALQLLPPRQRAALILRDVLGFRASEAAGILDCTEESVTSALKRARAALQYRRELAARFWAATAFRPGRSARLIPVHANGQPAFGLYVRDPRAPVSHANGIIVLTLAGSEISTVTAFPDNSLLRLFGLPRTLPD